MYRPVECLLAGLRLKKKYQENQSIEKKLENEKKKLENAREELDKLVKKYEEVAKKIEAC